MARLRPAALSAAVFLVSAVVPPWTVTGWTMEAANITVIVENLRSSDGEVRIALWSSSEDFIEPDKAVAETGKKAQIGQVSVTFSGLPPGRYAVASYHDENGNGAFDRTLLGLPKEGLGFSNGARIGLGPPAFEDAAVEVTGPQHVVIVRLRY